MFLSIPCSSSTRSTKSGIKYLTISLSCPLFTISGYLNPTFTVRDHSRFFTTSISALAFPSSALSIYQTVSSVKMIYAEGCVRAVVRYKGVHIRWSRSQSQIKLISMLYTFIYIGRSGQSRFWTVSQTQLYIRIWSCSGTWWCALHTHVLVSFYFLMY